MDHLAEATRTPILTQLPWSFRVVSDRGLRPTSSELYIQFRQQGKLGTRFVAPGTGVDGGQLCLIRKSSIEVLK